VVQELDISSTIEESS
jgi:hypothetical protein